MNLDQSFQFYLINLRSAVNLNNLVIFLGHSFINKPKILTIFVNLFQ